MIKGFLQGFHINGLSIITTLLGYSALFTSHLVQLNWMFSHINVKYFKFFFQSICFGPRGIKEIIWNYGSKSNPRNQGWISPADLNKQGIQCVTNSPLLHQGCGCIHNQEFCLWKSHSRLAGGDQQGRHYGIWPLDRTLVFFWCKRFKKNNNDVGTCLCQIFEKNI